MTDLQDITSDLLEKIDNLKFPLAVEIDRVWIHPAGVAIQLKWYFKNQRFGISRIFTIQELERVSRPLSFDLLLMAVSDWYEQNAFNP